jgi:hypothetical protein
LPGARQRDGALRSFVLRPTSERRKGWGETDRSTTRCDSAVLKRGELRLLSSLGRTLQAISRKSGSEVFRLPEAARRRRGGRGRHGAKGGRAPANGGAGPLRRSRARGQPCLDDPGTPQSVGTHLRTWVAVRDRLEGRPPRACGRDRCERRGTDCCGPKGISSHPRVEGSRSRGARKRTHRRPGL